MRPLLDFLSMIVPILGMATLLSCQDSLFYSEYKEMPNAQWDSRDTLAFQLPTAEAPLDATLTVTVRKRQEYDYKTIALKVEHLSNDFLVSSDTLHITLYDDNGLPLGRAFPISDNYTRPLHLHLGKDKHDILRITHLMRLNPLDGICDVGIFVERK